MIHHRHIIIFSCILAVSPSLAFLSTTNRHPSNHGVTAFLTSKDLPPSPLFMGGNTNDSWSSYYSTHHNNASPSGTNPGEQSDTASKHARNNSDNNDNNNDDDDEDTTTSTLKASRFSKFAPDASLDTQDFKSELKNNMKADLERRRAADPNRGNQPTRNYLNGL